MLGCADMLMDQIEEGFMMKTSFVIRVASFGVLATLLTTLWKPVPAMAQTAGTAPKKAVDPALLPIEDDPKLPRVFLIGDSISIGYTLPVRELLRGKANVHRPPVNSSSSNIGLRYLDRWLGEGKWDVIHFNFGLHDLKYIDDKGTLVSPEKGKQVSTIAHYQENLRAISQRLKKTGARVIWGAVTPVPQGTTGRVAGDELRYNEAAAQVMREEGIAINDLHAVAMKDIATYQLPRNVHFTKEGSQALAEAVAAQIEKALPVTAPAVQ
jgi:acyl-CoA thioesterase-1